MAQQQRETWKEYAGREWGRDNYVFGDNSRHLWKKMTGKQRDNANEAGVDDHDRAILDMKVQRDTLVGQRRRLERECQKDEEVARSLAREGRKELALLALRKKKHHQQLVHEAQSHLFRLEELIGEVESAQMQKEAVNTLAAGVGTLKRLQQEMGGVERVQQLMDDAADAAAEQREISAALAGAGIAEDDADALAEFERMQAAYAAQVLPPAAETVQPTPAASVHPPAPAVATEAAAPTVAHAAPARATPMAA
mmetsp:Transcript_103840/g.180412  ORF Transcript_103840/g.180412 Transcript_103840/m.180412 type:complete len:253 (-) Transcript_103840:42-800(-)